MNQLEQELARVGEQQSDAMDKLQSEMDTLQRSYDAITQEQFLARTKATKSVELELERDNLSLKKHQLKEKYRNIR